MSAQECAASATIEAEPVIPATIDFASAMSALAVNATMTVSIRYSLESIAARNSSIRSGRQMIRSSISTSGPL